MTRWSKPLGVLIIGAACANGAVAAEVPKAFAYEPTREPLPEETAPRLTLEEATQLALVDQPLLNSREATIEAAQQQAVAAAQLPDPKLSGALRDVPIDTAEAFSLRRDSFTEYTIGLSQEFPAQRSGGSRVLVSRRAQMSRVPRSITMSARCDGIRRSRGLMSTRPSKH